MNIPNDNKIVKKIIDDFLVRKEGKSILKNIEKKKLLNEGLLDSLDILTLASEIEKKTKRKIDISKAKNYNKFNKYKDLIRI
tara:strand:- start:3388 stop:3633 length:246 start_codon:yes stop_codon:yes gene_type:complete